MGVKYTLYCILSKHKQIRQLYISNTMIVQVLVLVVLPSTMIVLVLLVSSIIVLLLCIICSDSMKYLWLMTTKEEDNSK